MDKINLPVIGMQAGGGSGSGSGSSADLRPIYEKLDVLQIGLTNLQGMLTELQGIVDAHKEATEHDINALAKDATSTDFSELPLLCGQPSILFGAGTPQEAIVPDNWKQFDPDTEEGYNWNGEPSAIGQQYINTTATTGGRYIAVRGIEEGSLVWKNF